MESDINKIIALIVKEKPSLTQSQIRKMIEEKMKELGGLIDDYVIALMIAKELGIDLKSEKPKIMKLKIKDLISGLRNVNIIARVLKISEVVSFLKNNKEHCYIRLTVGDETGVITIVLWNEQTKLVRGIKPGDAIKLIKGYTKDYKGKVELYLGSEGNIIKTIDYNLPPLEYFVKKSLIDCTIVDIEEVISRPDFACIRGVDLNGRKIRIAVWDGLRRTLKVGRYYMCGLKQRFSSKNFVEYSTNVKKLRIFCLGENKSRNIIRKVYTPSNNPEEEKDVIIQGYFLALNPTKIPKVLIGDETELISLVLFYERLLPFLAVLKVGTKILLKGVDIIGGAKGKIFRIGRCSNIESFEEENFFRNLNFQKKFIIDCSRACITEGVVISANLNLRDYVHEKTKYILPYISLVIDDGTGQARICSSSFKVFEILSGMKIDELKEYYELGAAKEILDYMSEEIKGTEFEFWGYKYKTVHAFPLIVVFNARKKAFSAHYIRRYY